MDKAAKLGKASGDAFNRGAWIILCDLLKKWIAEGVPSEVQDFTVKSSHGITVQSLYCDHKTVGLRMMSLLPGLSQYLKKGWSQCPSDNHLISKKTELVC